MSTSIYHGFRLHTTDLGAALRLVQEFRDRLFPAAQEGMARLIARDVTRIIDRQSLGLPVEGNARNLPMPAGSDLMALRNLLLRRCPEQRVVELERDLLQIVSEMRFLFADQDPKSGLYGSPFNTAFFRITDRINAIRRTGGRDPEVDFGFEVVLIPHGDYIYGLYFTEQDEFAKWWKEEALVESFPFWDDTDPPESVSEEEWEERRRIWDAVLQMDSPGHRLSPAMLGFTAQCTPMHPDIAGMEDVIPFIPTLEARARWHAKDAVFQVLFQQVLDEEYGGVMPKDGQFGVGFRAMDRFESDEGKALLAREAERIRPLLIPEITLDLLSAKQS